MTKVLKTKNCGAIIQKYVDLTTFDGFQGYENITSFEIHYAPEFKSTFVCNEEVQFKYSS